MADPIDPENLPPEIERWCKTKAAAFNPKKGSTKTAANRLAELLFEAATRYHEVLTTCRNITESDAVQLVMRSLGKNRIEFVTRMRDYDQRVANKTETSLERDKVIAETKADTQQRANAQLQTYAEANQRIFETNQQAMEGMMTKLMEKLESIALTGTTRTAITDESEATHGPNGAATE